MAATVTIRRWTGAEANPTKNDITSINTRANTDDAHTTDGVTSPILIPTTGTNYSYWVTTRLSIDAINTGTVDNLRWCTDGSNNFGTGVDCVGNTATSYTQATGTIGQTGTPLTIDTYPSLDSPPIDVFTHSPQTPKTVTGSATTIGDLGDFFVYQIEVAATAGSGATATETFTWKYDDTSS